MNDSINFINPIQNVLTNRYKTDAKVQEVAISKEIQKVSKDKESLNGEYQEHIPKKKEISILDIHNSEVQFDYDYEKKVHFVVKKDDKGNVLTAMPFSEYINLINAIK